MGETKPLYWIMVVPGATASEDPVHVIVGNEAMAERDAHALRSARRSALLEAAEAIKAEHENPDHGPHDYTPEYYLGLGSAEDICRSLADGEEKKG